MLVSTRVCPAASGPPVPGADWEVCPGGVGDAAGGHGCAPLHPETTTASAHEARNVVGERSMTTPTHACEQAQANRQRPCLFDLKGARVLDDGKTKGTVLTVPLSVGARRFDRNCTESSSAGRSTVTATEAEGRSGWVQVVALQVRVPQVAPRVRGASKTRSWSLREVPLAYEGFGRACWRVTTTDDGRVPGLRR